MAALLFPEQKAGLALGLELHQQVPMRMYLVGVVRSPSSSTE